LTRKLVRLVKPAKFAISPVTFLLLLKSKSVRVVRVPNSAVVAFIAVPEKLKRFIAPRLGRTLLRLPDV
jgi:hypothetical protein